LTMSPERAYDMPGINVWVAPIEQEIMEFGLDRKQIRLEVEKRLVCTDLPVIQQVGGDQTPKFPCLGVMLHFFQPQEEPYLYIFSIEMCFIQRISLTGPPATDAMRMAWCREVNGEISRNGQDIDWANLYNSLGFLVDCFSFECFPPQAMFAQNAETQVLLHIRNLSSR
jgi:hypothetical protein